MPSLYNHIAGLPGLKRGLAVYCLRELAGLLTRAVMGKARGDAILALADAYRSYARQAPGHYAFTLQAPDPQDEEWQRLGAVNVEILLAILAPYRLSEDEAIHAIRSLRSIIHGFIALELAGGFAMPIKLDDSFDWLIRLYIEGLEQSERQE